MRGKVNFDVSEINPDEDHPRLCGEKGKATFAPLDCWGSPPPMRGKVIIRAGFGVNGRITPAYAGKRNYGHTVGYACKDHPRLCGEKIDIISLSISGAGSPPPMRGKVTPANTQTIPDRITPAYAGKRNNKHKQHDNHGDHPRLCGEKAILFQQRSLQMGSPPPMRGKVVPLGVVTVLSRITPAYAGKSSQDYSTEPFRLRITPAYAGKSSTQWLCGFQ